MGAFDFFAAWTYDRKNLLGLSECISRVHNLNLPLPATTNLTYGQDLSRTSENTNDTVQYETEYCTEDDLETEVSPAKMEADYEI